MKNFKHYLVVAILSLPCLILAQEKNFADLAKSFKNPLGRKVLEIKETNVFNEKLFDPSVKTPTRTYKAYFDGENAHYQEAFPVKSRETDIKNVRDVYLSENTIYCIDSVSTNSMIICNADSSDKYSAMRLKNMFFSYFSKFKDIINAKIPCDISKGNGQYLISYDENDIKNLLCIDEKTLLPLKLESRYPNGSLLKEMSFKYDKDAFIINTITYAHKEKDEQPDVWSVKSSVSIKIIEDTAFDKNPMPKDFGFRSIHDNRNGKNYLYAAFNKLPDWKFIDELFKNSDDVQRYNTEIHRLAHPNEFLGN